MSRLWWVVFLLGCPKTPSHLQVTPTEHETKIKSWTDRDALVAYLVGDDPLVRAPVLPEPLAAEKVDVPIAEWVREIERLEQGEGVPAMQLQQLEERYPNSPIVPLARGYRLRVAENQLGNVVVQQDDPRGAIAALLSPLKKNTADDSLVKDPLHFLSASDNSDVELRAYGDRWVLAAWLHSPDIPTEAVAEALGNPQWDRLSNLPIGILLRSRQATGDPAAGFQKLERATLLSLTRAAADRDHEQAAWADALVEARQELGTNDPIRLLLEQASLELSAAAADDSAAGGALIAATGLRWLEVCPKAPCAGLDRTELFSKAENWGDRSAKLARIWQVIALKDAIDTMEVGHDTILFPKAAVKLTDALLGTGAGPLDTAILRKARGDTTTWLAVTRAVGADASTEWEGARHALALHLERAASRALADHEGGPFSDLLSRITKRANR